MKLMNKTNSFIDRRIGEKNNQLSAEDRMVARFAAERAKHTKKNIYNLADDEILTHRLVNMNNFFCSLASKGSLRLTYTMRQCFFIGIVVCMHLRNFISVLFVGVSTVKIYFTIVSIFVSVLLQKLR